MSYVLSKSSFLKGLQCEKHLFLYKYHYNLMDNISEAQLAVFKSGHKVGLLARQLFPGGVDCSSDSPLEPQSCLNKTQAAIKAGATVLYEAGFVFDDVLVICDILVRKGKAWKIFEVKSSTSISEVYINDAAIQHYVVKNCLSNVSDISIIYINNQYIRTGELDVVQLFTVESVKDLVFEKMEFIKDNIIRLKNVIAKKKEPQIDIGPQCSDPYTCSFWGHCWKHIPEYSVFNISRLSSNKQFELYKQGIFKIVDIPDSFPLTEAQRLQVECEKENKTKIDKKALKSFLSAIVYPVAFMDFETFMPAIPLFNDSRPYQQIPFQYSVHYLSSVNGELFHKEYLAESDFRIDPRIDFIENLLRDIEGAKTIIVYNQNFEIARLKEIVNDFHRFETPIKNIIDKVIDLMKPFQNKFYYAPEMKGSYSIKKVLPALIPELSYLNMDIGEGGAASREFERIYYISDPSEISKVRSSLLEYCKMDTFALVKILKKLEEL